MTARSALRVATCGIPLALLSFVAEAANSTAVAPTVGVGWGDLAGPLGGALAAAFAGGAIAGYGFCVRTILKISNGRIAGLEETIKSNEVKFEVVLKEAESLCEKRLNRLEWKLDREQRRNRQLTDMLMGRRAVGKFSADLEDDSMPPDEEIDRQIQGLTDAT